MPIEDYPNLIPNSERSPEQLREQTRKGGIASGVARRKRKTFAEGIKQILDMPVDDPETLEALKLLGLDGTFLDAINLAQTAAARKGDTEAARFLRDTIGEKPREGLELGNLDDRPLETIDLSKLSDEQLMLMAAKRRGNGE